jgi:hypothetical protein
VALESLCDLFDEIISCRMSRDTYWNLTFSVIFITVFGELLSMFSKKNLIIFSINGTMEGCARFCVKDR